MITNEINTRSIIESTHTCLDMLRYVKVAKVTVSLQYDLDLLIVPRYPNVILQYGCDCKKYGDYI